MNSTDYKKLKQSFKYWILGKAESNPEYYRVIKALNFGELYHKGNRKDGKPEYSHQIAICSYLRTLHKYFKNPVSVFIVALLHDTAEDYPESIVNIEIEFPEEAEMIKRISKVRNGEKIPYSVYFGEMQECDVCSIVKLGDRIHNLSTMIKVFSYEKQTAYLKDLEDWFFPMLKYSKNKYPEQEPAYENMKSILYLIKDSILNTREMLEQK